MTKTNNDTKRGTKNSGMQQVETVTATTPNEIQVYNKLEMLPINEALEWNRRFEEFKNQLLKEGEDFGVIPGTSSKPSLFKSGAERLRFAFNLSIEMQEVTKTMDLDRGFIDYTYKATVKDKTGRILAECEGSVNSFETKYLYKNEWQDREKIKVRRTVEELIGSKNTIQKMAQKRAMVGAILIATGGSHYFTQDLEDMDTGGSGSKTKSYSKPAPKKEEKTIIVKYKGITYKHIKTDRYTGWIPDDKSVPAIWKTFKNGQDNPAYQTLVSVFKGENVEEKQEAQEPEEIIDNSGVVNPDDLPF